MNVIAGFIKKELIQLFRNPQMLVALLIMPLIQTLILNSSLSSTAQNIKLYVDGKADDYVLSKIQEKAQASKWFSAVEPTTETPFKAVQTGVADMVMVAPPKGFTRSLGSEKPELQVLIDASNVVKAQAMEQYAQAIVQKGLEETRFVTMPETTGISFKTRVLFNPEMETNYFLLPFLVAFQAAIMVIVLVSDSICREKEQGTFETLISAPIKTSHIIIGKTVPAVIVALLSMLSLQAEAMIVFHVPFVGSILQLIVVFTVMSVSFSAFSIWLSTICTTQKQGMFATMMVIMVLMLLSGGMAPVDNMPFILRYLSYCNPLYHLSEVSRTLFLKGCEWGYCFRHMGAVMLFGLVFGLWGMRRFKTTL
ncbi:MAG: ABC transporter permease [Alphaproteobacteria bacterium]|nr:ABC transporter permease [Alphaproteobacteria bacterium]